MKALKMVLLVVLLSSFGCAPTLKQGNVVRQFDTPTSHYERKDLVNGAGRVDSTEIGWSDIPGGGMGFGVAPTGPGVTSVRDAALRALAPQPGAMVCDPVNGGMRCHPAGDEVTFQTAPRR